MILGHWYLVTPKLPEAPLILISRGAARGRRPPGRAVRGLGRRPAPGPAAAAPFAVLVGPWALFVWLRLIVGLIFPLVVSWAAVQTARIAVDGVGDGAAVHQRRDDRRRDDPRRRALLRGRPAGVRRTAATEVR